MCTRQKWSVITWCSDLQTSVNMGNSYPLKNLSISCSPNDNLTTTSRKSYDNFWARSQWQFSDSLRTLDWQSVIRPVDKLSQIIVVVLFQTNTLIDFLKGVVYCRLVWNNLTGLTLTITPFLWHYHYIWWFIIRYITATHWRIRWMYYFSDHVHLCLITQYLNWSIHRASSYQSTWIKNREISPWFNFNSKILSCKP